jgi:ribose transport system ATP-binding protein
MRLDGQDVDFQSPAEAQHAGVTAVHQEPHLLRYRTVAENVFLGREPRRMGLVDWRRMNDDSHDVLQGLGLDIDPRATVDTLSTAQQQMVAIARGVSLGAKVLVLDEPTSSLTEREVSILYDLVRRLQTSGVAVVYISHRFDELYAICDRVTVLRDGSLVGTHDLSAIDRLDLVCLMLGRSRDELRAGTTAFHDRPRPGGGGAPLLRVDRIGRRPKLDDVSVEVRTGEIVGLAGLLGAGRTETARVAFGADRAERGTVYARDAVLDARAPDDAIAAGFAFISEDRKAEGIIPELSVRENLTLAALPALTRLGVVDRAKQREIVERFMKRLGIKASSAEQRIRELSGGNQQKVLLARWLCTKPALLILDEPTRGIDIGAKGEIQSLVNELAAEGLGVLMISSELEELVEGCSRIVVLREGHNVAELKGAEISAPAVVRAMAGTTGGGR